MKRDQLGRRGHLWIGDLLVELTDPNEQSTHICPNCGTSNASGTLCAQCQSEVLDNRPAETLSQDIHSDDQQGPLIHHFQNLFTDDFDLQSFADMLLPMLMSRVQSDLRQHRSRRGRPPRRIKRITHPPLAPRYLPSLALPPYQISPLPLLNINELVPGQLLNTQFQPNMPFIQVPLQLFVFGQNRDDLNVEMLTQLLHEDNQILPIARQDIDQLPVTNITPSNLSINPSCAICLENFEPSSEVKQLPVCHHVFHIQCLTEWLLRHGNCPMCRTAVLPSQPATAPVINDHWMQQFFFPTLAPQPTNAVVPYLPIKTINPIPTTSDTVVPDPPPPDAPQLPRFHSSSNMD